MKTSLFEIAKRSTWAIAMSLSVALLLGSVYMMSLSHDDLHATKTVIDSILVDASMDYNDAGVISSDAGVPVDAGAPVVDAQPVKVRPTAQQLADQYMTWDLKDLLNQAETSEDKKLVQEALDIRRAKAKALELSNDFEKNMQKALK